MKYLAKSSGETLKEHSIKLMLSCYDRMKKIGLDKELKVGREIIRYGLIASLFHDIGKTSLKFQNYLNGIETESPGHSVVGALLFEIVVENSTFNDITIKKIIKDIIMCHMTDPTYDNKFLYDYYNTNDIKSVIEFIKDVIETFESEFEKINGYHFNMDISFNDIEDEDLDIKLTTNRKFKFPHSEYIYATLKENRDRYIINKIYFESIFVMLFDVVRWCDIHVSSGNILFDVESNKRYDRICEKPLSYDMERWIKQVKYAKEIADSIDKNIFSIEANTGFGKTMIAILTTIFSGGYSYFVLPTNELAKNIYKNIRNGLKDLGMDDEISVALLLGGKWVEGGEYGNEANIIVTNIDNFELNTFKNKRKKIAIQHLNRTCIFDEWHSYICSEPLMFSFVSTIKERSMCKNIKTVLMSATPIYNKFYIQESDVEIIKIENDNFSNRMVQFTFDNNIVDAIEKYYGNTLVDKDVLCVACTIPSADYIHEKVDDIIHSRFISSDKEDKMNDLTIYKGKTNRSNYSISSTNNMISQGVDCSFDGGTIVENAFIEYIIQILGRDKRYTNDGIRYCHLCLDPSNKFRFSESEWKIITDEYNFLKNTVRDRVITSKELDNLRNEFDETNRSVKDYIRELISKSYDNYIHIEFSDGYDIKGDDEETLTIISTDNMTMRGNDNDNIYAVFKDINGNIINEPMTFPAYHITDNIVDAAYKYIRGDDMLITKYFTNKHIFKNIKNKKEYLIKKSRNIETPFPILCDGWIYNKKRGAHQNK